MTFATATVTHACSAACQGSCSYHAITIEHSLQEAADCNGSNLASTGTTFTSAVYPEQSLANARQLIVEAIEHLQVRCPDGMHEKPVQ